MQIKTIDPRVSFIDEAPYLASTSENANKCAISNGKISMSYKSLNKAINGACARLKEEENLHPKDRIALYLPNSIELIIYILAALRLNITAVPINIKYHPDTIEYILNQSKAKIVLTDLKGSKALKSNLVRITDGIPYSDENFFCEEKTPNDLAVIYYTSGSTGRPKGVMTSHENLLLGADSVSSYLGIDKKDKLAAILPLAFDAGLNFVLSGLYIGAHISFISYLLPKSLIKSLRDEDINCLLLVPSVYQQILPHLDTPLPSLRVCASTGGTMPTETVDSLLLSHPRLSFYVMYGLTEAFRSTFLHPSEYLKKKGSIGKAIPHVEIFVVNKDGEECKPNERGEIVHCGPLVGLGYLDNPEATAARFRPTPKFSRFYDSYKSCVYSGDMGWKDKDGYLYFVGRSDRMIKSKGFRIAPEEIEKAVTKHTSYSLCYALGEKHSVHGQIVTIVVESEETPDLRLIQNKLRPHISGFMMPEKVLQVKKMPLNTNGKIDGKALYSLLEIAS